MTVQVGQSPLTDVQLKLVETPDDAAELRQWMGERRDILGVDTESEGLDPARHDLRLIQVGDRMTGWAIPWPLWGGLAQWLLRAYDRPMVAHHLKHDEAFLRRRAKINLPWATTRDTMIQLACVDPTQPKGLKPASARLIDRNATAGERLLSDGMSKNGWTWATVPYDFPPYWIYSALDPVLTCWLDHLTYPQVRQKYQPVYDLEMGVARIAGRMMDKGMMIDRAYVNNAITTISEHSRTSRAWLAEHYNVTSPLSAKQLYAAFLRTEFEITGVTGTGLPKVDKETLEGIALGMEGVSPAAAQLAKVVLNTRHADKVIGSYLEAFLELADANDVVHCGINTIAARTGRQSISDPPLQQLPRTDKMIRGSFIPRPGHVFITCDFSQIEMRLAAALAEDDGLIQAFREADNGGQDFYSGIASELFGEPVNKTDPRRQAVKTISYAKLYGAGLDTMARKIGLPTERVRVMREAYDTRFPRLDAYTRQITSRAYAQKKANERPCTHTTLGRYLPADNDREFALLNYRIQGEAADIMKQGTVRAANAGLEEYLCLPVHDELILEVPREDAQDVHHVVMDAMADLDSYAVPITCDAAILTERWAKV